VRDVLAKTSGEAVRFLLMRSHYRSTLDFSEGALYDAKRELDRFYRAITAHPVAGIASTVPVAVMSTLCDDLNTPGAISGLHALADAALAGDAEAAAGLRAAGQILGLFNVTPDAWFHGHENNDWINNLIEERQAARKSKNFARADEIRKQLEDGGFILEDIPGATLWRRKN
jgi:cysteinyl-tRNA synthetase